MPCPDGKCKVLGRKLARTEVMEAERQYLATEFLTIVTDSDNKPTVRYFAADKRIEIIGEMAFGTTIRARKILTEHSEAQALELKGDGGRLTALIDCHQKAFSNLGGYPAHPLRQHEDRRSRRRRQELADGERSIAI